MFSRKLKTLTVIVSLLTIGAIVASCKQASYEFVGKKKSETTPPQTLGPEPTPSDPAYNFTIGADPTTQKIKLPINFTARGCGADNDGTVTWEFGDNITDQGTNINYSYKYKGKFTVNATCETKDGNKLTAQVVVTILPASTSCGNSCPNSCSNPCRR